MTKDQAIAELKFLRRRNPFLPFVIVLSDGRRLSVNRPLQYAFQEWGGVVIGERDRLNRFKPAEIVAIEVAAPVG